MGLGFHFACTGLLGSAAGCTVYTTLLGQAQRPPTAQAPEAPQLSRQPAPAEHSAQCAGACRAVCPCEAGGKCPGGSVGPVRILGVSAYALLWTGPVGAAVAVLGLVAAVAATAPTAPAHSRSISRHTEDPHRPTPGPTLPPGPLPPAEPPSLGTGLPTSPPACAAPPGPAAPALLLRPRAAKP